MLTLEVDESYVYLVNAGFTERDIVRRAVQARPNGYRFMRSYREGYWDGYISLLTNRKFPSGLLPIVECALKEHNVAYVVKHGEDFRPAADISSKYGNYELRDYQREAVMRVLEHRRGTLHMATNAGKTLVIAAIIHATGMKAVVVVPTRALLLQTAKKLGEMLQVHIGRLGAGHWEKQDVSVVTMTSLGRSAGLDWSGNITLVVDECHHTSANSIFDNVFSLPGRYRIGLSGTPLKHDELSDLKLVGATGPVIYSITNAELIAAGFSVVPTVMLVTIKPPQGEWHTDYHDAYRTCIVDNRYRNDLIGAICLKERERGPVMVLVNWIEHVGAILDVMPRGVSAIDVTGNNSSDDIQARLDMLRNREVDCLVATDVFGEGVDIPSVATVVLAAGGQSHIKLLQRVGRGLRVTDGKSTLHVYDFIDSMNKYLLTHSEKRRKLYIQEGFQDKYVSVTELLG